MSTSSASSFDTHPGSSPGLPPTARALPSGWGGGAAQVTLVVGAVGVVGVIAGLVVIAVHGDPHRQQAVTVVVANPEHTARGVRVRPQEIDLVDGRMDRLAILRAEARAAAVRERLRPGGRSLP